MSTNPHGGPRTEAGKAASSQNAITHGLFATKNLILPGEETDAAQLSESLQSELAPEGTLEASLAGEIYRALWRLRRCAVVEQRLAALLSPDDDPMENSSTVMSQLAVDRARAQAHRLFLKSTAELSCLQTERHFRQQYSDLTPTPRPSACATSLRSAATSTPEATRSSASRSEPSVPNSNPSEPPE